MNEKKSRKEWIKSFAIVFLSVLLVLTFFSNTIRNYSLPEVSAQYTDSGSITNKIRGQGIVTATDPYKVIFKQSRKVDSVAVRVGDDVEKGQIIYILEGGDSEELKEAIATLDSLKLAYERKLLTEQISASVSGAVEKGQTGDTASNQAKITSLKNRIEKLEKEVASYDSQIEAWTTGDPNAIKERKDLLELKKAETAWNNQLKISTTNFAEVSRRVNDKHTSFSDLENDITALSETAAMNTAKTNLEIAKAAEEAAKSAYEADTTDDSLLTAWEAAKTTLVAAQTNYDNAVAAYNNTEEVKLKKEYEQRKVEKETAEYYADISPVNTSIAQKKVDDKVDELRNARATVSSNLTKAQEELTNFVSNLSTQLDLSDALKAIEKQQEVVDKLRSEQGGAEITAPVSGTILSLSRVAGETIENGEAVATIQMKGKGYTMTMNVTNEQATLIHVGDEAEISNSWWYMDVKARIQSIRPDPNNHQGGKIVTFELEGDVSDGQSLSVTVGKRTSNYDTIVPNSAIREDNKGKFVFRIVSKNSPLGTRYNVERVDVKVLAEDDTRSAISGALNNWEYIVTTSAKPLEDGQLVRLKE